MTCYLVRHGKDDDTVRGGWSDHGLTPLGIEQVHTLAQSILAEGIHIDCIYSSDLQRAKQTAVILANYLNVPVTYHPGFRETNNGELAGMKHELAKDRFPGLYWSSLDYTECYPGGESPEAFFHRIQNTWAQFKNDMLAQPRKNVLLVTHGGVIETILCIEHGKPLTNRHRYFSAPNAELIPVELCKGGP